MTEWKRQGRGNAPGHARTTRATFDALLAELFGPVCLTIAATYFVTLVVDFHALPLSSLAALVISASLCGLLFLLAALAGFAGKIRPEKSHFIAGCLGLAAVADALFRLYRLQGASGTTDLILIVMAGGFFLFSLRWLLFIAATLLSGWFLLTAASQPFPSWLQSSFSLVVSVAFAVAFQQTRNAIYTRYESLRLRYRRLTSELRSTLEATEKNLYRLTHNADDIIFRVSLLPTPTLQFVNPAVAKIVGYTPEELYEDQWIAMSLVHRDDRDLLAPFSAPTHEQHRLTFRCRHRDGSLVWLEARAGVVTNPTGEVEAVEGVIRDITESKMNEEALRVAKEKAEAANRVKNSILANMSHEIRTPMTAILGFSEILQKQVDDSVARNYARIINQGGSRLMHLLDGIVDLARLEAGRFDIDVAPHRLNDSIDHVVGLLGVLAAQKSLQLRVRVDRELLTHTDARREEQILTNIIGNAIRFTETGAICVTAEDDGCGSAVIRVEDTGIGIDESFLPLVFEEFRQESEGLRRKHEGSGLGLPIAKRLAERMGGSITVKSRKGEGTCVTIALPLSQETPVPLTNARRPDIEPPGAGHLLIVEDDADAALLIREALHDRFDHIVHAAHADEALEQARLHPFDFVLVDIHLVNSHWDGVETMRRLRALPAYGETPIVALTAFAMQGDRERLLDAGFSAYLAKPFSAAALIDVLERQRHAAPDRLQSL